jgi:hypothetical protein
MTLFTYVCRDCGQEVPADEWELAQHSLLHNKVLLTDQPLPTEEDQR